MANLLKHAVRRIRQSAIPILMLVLLAALRAQEPTQTTDDGIWGPYSKTDAMTDQTTVGVQLNKRVEYDGRPGKVQVVATCDSQSLTFQLIYVGQGFKQNVNVLTKPRVYMRVRLDQDQAFSVGSASDYPNVAFVRFVHESHDPMTVLSNLGAAMSPIKAMSAHLIKVELPLDDGDVPILEISPQDPTLKKFLNGCDFEEDPAIPTSKSPLRTDSALRTLTNRTYYGTVEGFAQELPEFMKRATIAMRLRPEDYAKETASIIGAVRTCAQVTPQMYASLGRGGRPDFSKLGSDYAVCNPRTSVSDSARPTIMGKPSPGIEMEMFRVGNRGSTTDDSGFSVVISFSTQNGDSYRSLAFDDYGIVAAAIYSSPSAVKHPGSATPLQKLTNRRYTGTVDNFAEELPDFVQRAAQTMSLNPDNYEKEIAFAIKFVRTCAQITPEMASQNAAHNFGQVNLSKLGDQYKDCQSVMGFRNISDEVKTYNKGLERGIQLQVNPHNGDWKSGQGLDIRVFFSPLKSETLTSPSSYFDTLGIVMATVH